MMALSPAPLSSAPVSSGVPVSGAGELGHCGVCAFMSPGRHQEWVRGTLQRSADIHCGFYDRRVTPVKGCAKFFGTGAQMMPHPLEH